MNVSDTCDSAGKQHVMKDTDIKPSQDYFPRFIISTIHTTGGSSAPAINTGVVVYDKPDTISTHMT